MKVAVIGCGKLGAPLALLLAEAGLDVTAIDTNPDLLDSLKRGVPTHHEPHLAEMLGTWGPSIDWRSDLADAAACEVVFIVVPTPSIPFGGEFDVSTVEAVVEAVGEVARNGRSLAVCVVSTVNPGDCEAKLAEALRAVDLNGRAALVYGPEFVALGDVFAGMRRPDLILIGEQERWAGDLVLTCLRAIKPGLPDDLPPGQAARPHAPAVHRMGWTDAEIAKLSLNVALTVKLALASTIGALVAAHGGNPRQVADAVGSDRRIGRPFLSPGPPPAGPCLPRDGVAFGRSAERVDLFLPLIKGVAEEAEANRWRIAERVAAVLPTDGIVALLGMTYKPGSEVSDGAIGPWLADTLPTVITHDPLIDSDEMNAQTAVGYADVVVLCTDDPAWCKLDYRGKVCVDLWGLPVHIDGATYVGPS